MASMRIGLLIIGPGLVLFFRSRNCPGYTANGTLQQSYAPHLGACRGPCRSKLVIIGAGRASRDFGTGIRLVTERPLVAQGSDKAVQRNRGSSMYPCMLAYTAKASDKGSARQNEC